MVPTEEIYGKDPETGLTVLLETIIRDGSPELLEGEATLVSGNATVLTAFAGKKVILSRNQSLSSGIGHLYVDEDHTVVGESFRIRSTNSSDNGTVYWQIVES